MAEDAGGACETTGRTGCGELGGAAVDDDWANIRTHTAADVGVAPADGELLGDDSDEEVDDEGGEVEEDDEDADEDLDEPCATESSVVEVDCARGLSPTRSSADDRKPVRAAGDRERGDGDDGGCGATARKRGASGDGAEEEGLGGTGGMRDGGAERGGTTSEGVAQCALVCAAEDEDEDEDDDDGGVAKMRGGGATEQVCSSGERTSGTERVFVLLTFVRSAASTIRSASWLLRDTEAAADAMSSLDTLPRGFDGRVEERQLRDAMGKYTAGW